MAMSDIPALARQACDEIAAVFTPATTDAANRLCDEIERARRIASYPAHAIRMAKQAVDAAALDPTEGLLEEAWLFAQTLGDLCVNSGTRAAER